MSQPSYDKSSVASIYKHSRALKGKTLAQAVTLPPQIVNSKNRGDLGKLTEVYYFEHNPPNTHDPDFAQAGLELKTTGTQEYKRAQISGETLKAKERLKLTSIDFSTLGQETWETSTLFSKCNLMLILFYKYDKSVSVVEQYFELDPLLLTMDVSKLTQSNYEKEFILKTSIQIPEEDLAIIKEDWEYIRSQAAQNKAHELSEGDTNYLGACRSGSGGENEPLKKQANNSPGAKGRAFAFKQGYLSKLVQGHSKREVSLGIGKNLSFEDVIEAKFKEYIGLTVPEICKKLNYSSSAKQIKSLLCNRILMSEGKKIIEFEKAGIRMKTFSLNASNKAREDISFPAFVSGEVVSQNWEDSEFATDIEDKFLWVVFKQDENGADRLIKVVYWNMPYSDRLKAQEVWENMKERLLTNPQDVKGNFKNDVAHVRPHGKNSKDYDESLSGLRLRKRCFWLNGSYIAKVVS